MPPLAKIHNIFSWVMELELEFFSYKLKILPAEVTELRLEKLNFFEYGHDQVENVFLSTVLWLFFKGFN